jgi:hypothetical protein
MNVSSRVEGECVKKPTSHLWLLNRQTLLPPSLYAKSCAKEKNHAMRDGFRNALMDTVDTIDAQHIRVIDTRILMTAMLYKQSVISSLVTFESVSTPSQ